MNVQVCICLFCHMFSMKLMLRTSCVLSMKCFFERKEHVEYKVSVVVLLGNAEIGFYI